MKRIALTLLSVGALALTACDGTSDELEGGGLNRGSNDRYATAGNEDNTANHNNDPGAADPAAGEQPPEPAQNRKVGSPEVTSRLHSCGKLTYSSLKNVLDSRGLTGQGGGRPQGVQSSRQIFDGAAGAFGGPNYAGRVPEAPFASTSAVAKMFDIFVMASYDATADNFNAPACPDTKIIGADGKFTKDGLTCLMGKPATDAHLATANQAIAANTTDGARIAIAALLSAAHTCQ